MLKYIIVSTVVQIAKRMDLKMEHNSAWILAVTLRRINLSPLMTSNALQDALRGSTLTWLAMKLTAKTAVEMPRLTWRRRHIGAILNAFIMKRMVWKSAAKQADVLPIIHIVFYLLILRHNVCQNVHCLRQRKIRALMIVIIITLLTMCTCVWTSQKTVTLKTLKTSSEKIFDLMRCAAKHNAI